MSTGVRTDTNRIGETVRLPDGKSIARTVTAIVKAPKDTEYEEVGLVEVGRATLLAAKRPGASEWEVFVPDRPKAWERRLSDLRQRGLLSGLTREMALIILPRVLPHAKHRRPSAASISATFGEDDSPWEYT